MPINKQIKDATSLIGQSIEALAKIESSIAVQAIASLEEANRMLAGVLSQVTGKRSLYGNRSQLEEIADKLSNNLAFRFRQQSAESILEGLLELNDKVGDQTLNLVDFRNLLRGSILLGKRENLGNLPNDLVNNGCILRARDEKGFKYRLTDEFKDAVTKYKLQS